MAAQEAVRPSLELLRRVREGLIHLSVTDKQESASVADTAVEFPTLDLEELSDAPLRPAVYLTVVERTELPCILATRLPGVVHAPRKLSEGQDVHEFIDTTSGAAVRYVLSIDSRGCADAAVAESGKAGFSTG